MHVLFVHQNYPAQFRCVAPRLAADFGWSCTFCTRNDEAPDLPGVRRVLYRPAGAATRQTPLLARPFDNALAHARGVYEAMKAHPEVRPDLVVAHSGFGSSLFLPYLYDAPVINFFEYFYRPTGQDLGYRPEMPLTEQMLLRTPCRNAMILLDWDACARGWCPSFSQRDLFPPALRDKIEVIPEGVDTSVYRRRDEARLKTADGSELKPGTRVVTYVSRGFELMRGFDIFMKAAKRIYEQCPEVIFVVVGTDQVCYGPEQALVNGNSFLRHVLQSDRYDLSRFCFAGHVPEDTLAKILSASDLHVYLTAPFVTSWSLLDAMACGATVLASDPACVREYITHGENGLLCDFFDVEGIATQALRVLRDPAGHRHLGEAARRTVAEKYALPLTLPRIKAFFEQVTAAGPRTPSLVAQRLVRPGTLGRVVSRRGAAGSESRPGPAPRPDTGRGTSGPRRARPAGDAPTVLFTWELGRGLGHMLPMLPLAEGLAARGCRVWVALRTLSAAAAKVFGRAGVSFLQAPIRSEGTACFHPTLSLAHILGNIGWGDELELFALGSAWRNLLRQVRPDLIVFDHSPTALLAARALPPRVRKVLMSPGFFCPPDLRPLPPFVRGVTGPALVKLAADEEGLRLRANRLLSQWSAPPLERLGRLYADVDGTMLTTFPELDHYPGRDTRGDGNVRYWGPVTSSGGKTPEWPDVPHRKRIYAYLKGSPSLPEVLKVLRDRGDSTLVFADGIDAAVLREFSSPTLKFETERLDMARVGAECDVAVHNANHGTLARLLLCGRPMLQLPLTLEQKVLARAVERTGAAETASVAAPDLAGDVARKLDALLSEPGYANAAARFAATHADFNPVAQEAGMLERLEELLGTGRKAPRRPAELGIVTQFATNVPAGVFRE